MSDTSQKLRVLFVCLGNICRSPTAEGVFRAAVENAGLSERIEVDSAGTGDWHIGSPPDIRAQVAAYARGVDIQGLRARQVRAEDFERFDVILAMDHANLGTLERLKPDGARATVSLFLDAVPDAPTREIPDPYYGARDGFQEVLDMIEAASEGLLQSLKPRIE